MFNVEQRVAYGWTIITDDFAMLEDANQAMRDLVDYGVAARDLRISSDEDGLNLILDDL